MNNATRKTNDIKISRPNNKSARDLERLVSLRALVEARTGARADNMNGAPDNAGRSQRPLGFGTRSCMAHRAGPVVAYCANGRGLAICVYCEHVLEVVRGHPAPAGGWFDGEAESA
jgi:hypothetical protein